MFLALLFRHGGCLLQADLSPQAVQRPLSSGHLLQPGLRQFKDPCLVGAWPLLRWFRASGGHLLEPGQISSFTLSCLPCSVSDTLPTLLSAHLFLQLFALSHTSPPQSVFFVHLDMHITVCT